jgi:hypothetical protein
MYLCACRPKVSREKNCLNTFEKHKKQRYITSLTRRKRKFEYDFKMFSCTKIISFQNIMTLLKYYDALNRGGIHKKISGLGKKNEESSTCFFFKISVRGPKQKLGRGADVPPISPLSPPLLPSSPILSIPFLLEIDPLGIYRLTFLRHARGSCFTVARGQHSRMRL